MKLLCIQKDWRVHWSIAWYTFYFRSDWVCKENRDKRRKRAAVLVFGQRRDTQGATKRVETMVSFGYSYALKSDLTPRTQFSTKNSCCLVIDLYSFVDIYNILFFQSGYLFNMKVQIHYPWKRCESYFEIINFQVASLPSCFFDNIEQNNCVAMQENLIF